MNICKCGCGQHCNKLYCRGHYLKHYLQNNKHYNNKGEKRKNVGGYIMVYHPNHPKVSKNTYYIMEHRLIMEEYLGRYLENWETIHHINGIKDDNRIENMKLCSNSEHTTHHNIVDMSNRICLMCNSNKTHIQSRNGRPNWYKYKDGFICHICYKKWRYYKKRVVTNLA